MRRKVYNFDGADSVSVGEYLQGLNDTLEGQRNRIQGEVCNLKMYEGRSYMYFSVKDKEGEAMLNCFMWKRDYNMSVAELEEGLEVIIEGYPKIYMPNGSLSFQTETVELVGEGALKAAYDRLKAKLEAEGVFSEEKKRPVQPYPHRIGIVTSRDGAVLSDFRSNIGHFGFELVFVNSKVEGQAAVKDLIAAVRTLRTKNLDALVVMRGGGSLESFAAFNSEMLVREIANFPAPVIAGIGHDKDVCLVALAADAMVSTPTAVAEYLNDSWEHALAEVKLHERDIFGSFRHALHRKELLLMRSSAAIRQGFKGIFESFREMENSFYLGMRMVGGAIKAVSARVAGYSGDMSHNFRRTLATARHALDLKEKELGLLDPERQLRLGYSIVRMNGKIIRNAKDAKVGENVNIRMHEGEVEAEVKDIRT